MIATFRAGVRLSLEIRVGRVDREFGQWTMACQQQARTMDTPVRRYIHRADTPRIMRMPHHHVKTDTFSTCNIRKSLVLWGQTHL